MHCNICDSEMGDPIYESPSNIALTSLCELRSARTKVWLCSKCSHLRNEALPDTEDYYETGYRILLDQDDEDQIYEVQSEGKILYRTDHQVATLTQKLDLPTNCRLLDYGCAKASTPRRLLSFRSDIRVHLYDVSSMYTRYWQEFLPTERWAIHDHPVEWFGSFEVVTSFFALEHIPNPLHTVQRISSLLTEDGVFYGIVPDTFGNVADFIVVDHVNHFTDVSLHTLLKLAGFTQINIDANVHRGALVFTARKSGSSTQCPDVTSRLESCGLLARYWAGMTDHVRAAEKINLGVPSAIYGSGFYGAYIASSLEHPERLRCFLDSSPYQQGKVLFGKNILPPRNMPEDIRVLYVGLNPAIARKVMGDMDWLKACSNIQIVFLNEDELC